MIGLAVFLAIFALLGFNWWFRIHRIKALAEKLGGQRLLGRGTLALETSDYILEIVDVGWRVEVPRVLLGRRMVLTLDTGFKRPGGITTGFIDVDRKFCLTADDPDLTAAVFGDVAVRTSLLRLNGRCDVVRLNITAGETLVVLFRRRRRVSEREALESIVAFARALNDVADIKVAARPSTGVMVSGSTGGASGSPIAMPTGR